MENISFRHLKTVVRIKGTSFKDLASRCGVAPERISQIARDITPPKTDLLAKICSVLEVYPSEVVLFEGIKVNEKFKEGFWEREPLPKEYNGELTYKPLWIFLEDYIADYNKDKENNEKRDVKYFFDRIEPPRRLKGIEIADKYMGKKYAEEKYGKDYVSPRKNKTDYSKGLPAATRTKLRNDRPLNLAVIYEICKKLGCTIDYVLSYK